MEINSIVPLDWDSQFFGYPVAKISFGKDGADKLENVFQQINSENIRLTYLFVNPDDREINRFIEGKGCLLADQKVVFAKTTEKHFNFKNKIIEFQETEINEKILSLALISGIWSRFRIDKNFVNNEFERLYTEWLSNSINKTIALKTLVAIQETDFVGITTLGEKSDYADIGLVAVDENHRGQGIGYDLIHTADNTAFNLGYEKIKVVTQLKNNEACNLYKKCNFHVESITNIYHYWK
jgi:dTDP-4-amino-4,6-dideoxy-D-galactose acyltransferase